MKKHLIENYEIKNPYRAVDIDLTFYNSSIIEPKILLDIVSMCLNIFTNSLDEPPINK